MRSFSASSLTRTSRQRKAITVQQVFPARGSSSVKELREVHHRHAAQQAIVDDLRLRQIGQLGRTADVGDGRQQIILHHRAQQSVGRDFGGAVAQIGRIRNSLRRSGTRSPFSSRKNSDVFGVQMNLRVITGGFQFTIAFEQPRFQLGRRAQRFGDQRRADLSHRRVQRIEKQQIRICRADSPAARGNAAPMVTPGA